MIELRHFRYFIAVAEELNFRRASERVHIDQTPLSRAIRDLEDQLGVALFVRAPRNLHLTPAGARLLREARKIFIRIERTLRAVRETDIRYRSPLRIGVADGISQPRLSECFMRWRNVAPEIPLELTEMRATELSAALKREEVDVGFSFGLPDDDAVAQEPAWSYPLLALLPRGHELASSGALALPDLLAFPLLSCSGERQPGLVYQIMAIIRRHAETPTLAGEANTLSGYVTRVAAGMGVGLADAGHVETLHRSDVVVVPLVETEHVITHVLHKHQRFGSPEAVQRFVAHAKTLH
jgi:DNA-binding transcriptional LysR family regulator